MKYMGSKRWMLQNGLGSVLTTQALKAERFVDLFAGSGVVAHFVAQKREIPVLAFDMQQFSSVLSRAIIGRKRAVAGETIWKAWKSKAEKIVQASRVTMPNKLTQKTIKKCRAWSNKQLSLPVTKAYGGHYFSPKQSVWIDALRQTLPNKEPERTVALAALIHAASKCAAAPGHTAQPFQPTRTAKKFLIDAWKKDIVERTRKSLLALSGKYAKRVGRASIGDANKVAKRLKEGDLAFIDPPYSGVHYSRFYHVLETIARGDCGDVSGIGRYPDPSRRPRSKYSIGSKSEEALEELLRTISSRGARAVVTFPSTECSNGLSGNFVLRTAEKYFSVNKKTVTSNFSTLGGPATPSKTGNKRTARSRTKELILVLEPKES